MPPLDGLAISFKDSQCNQPGIAEATPVAGVVGIVHKCPGPVTAGALAMLELLRKHEGGVEEAQLTQATAPLTLHCGLR